MTNSGMSHIESYLHNDFHENIYLAPRLAFDKKIAKLIGCYLGTYRLYGYRFNPETDELELHVLNEYGQIITYLRKVPRSEMDLSPKQLLELYHHAVHKAIARKAS